MDKNVAKKQEVLRAAQNWWSGKADPIGASYGTYVCDACGGPIREKDGTSLLGGWIRCANCTQKLFSRWDKGED